MIFFSPVDPGGGGGGSGVTDHGALTGLADNDHPQYALDADFDAHTGDSTDVHGIADTSALETQSGAQTKADDAQSAAESTAASALSTHEADTTSIHGIADTANILLKTLADAKGDLLVATAADTIARKAVGANGTLFIANSGDASGTEWRTLVDGDIPATIARDAEVTSAIGTHEADTTSVHGIADTSTLYRSGGTDVALADGGTGASLVDPNADRILFWDDSAGAVTWLAPGTNLTITGTTIDAAGGGGASNVTLCRLAADSARSATAKADLTGMVFTLAANSVYSFEFVLMCSANAATVGIQYAITFPGTITRFDGNLDYYITVSAKGSIQVTGDATSPFDFNPTVSHGNVVLQNRINGTIEVGASGGAFQLQHGSETATLTTVLRGSYGTCFKH